MAAIIPGEGVRLEGGELIRGRVVLSNADPKRTLALCEGEVSPTFRERVETWRSEGAVVKLNCGLARLPTFTSRAAIPTGRLLRLWS